MTNDNHFTEIIFEKFQKEVKLVAEGHLLLKEKLEEIRERVEKIETRLDFAGIPKKYQN
ncbi:MAG: hypothetical protein WC901_03385 [Candidatus Margulisiibacteriota bacterium]